MINSLRLVLLVFVAGFVAFVSPVRGQAPAVSLSQGFAPGNSPAGVAYGNSKYVSIAGTAVYHSADGRKWEPAANLAQTLSSLVFGSGTFVGVGDNGLIRTSSDGLTWTTAVSGTTSDLTDIRFMQNAFFVIGDNGLLLTSADGFAWTPVTVNGPPEAIFSDIAYGAGKYIISYGTPSGLKVLKSATGASNSWTSQDFGGGNSINTIQYLKDRFFVFTSDRTVYTSIDGDTWNDITGAAITLPDNSNITFGGATKPDRAGLYDGTNIYLFGTSAYDGGAGTVFRTTDGVNFTLIPRTVEAATAGAALLNGMYFKWDNDGLLYSSDGLIYHQTGSNFTAAATNGTTSVIVGVAGTNGMIGTSTGLPAFEDVTPAVQKGLKGVAHNGSKYLAVGDKTIVESADGSTWSAIGDDSNYFTSVAYGNGIFVAVGAEDGTFAPKIAYSSTGAVWTTANSDNNQYFKVKYVNNRFFALGDDKEGMTPEGVIYTSTDGIAWTNVTPINLADEVASYNDVTWDGTRYHFMGMEYVGPKTEFIFSFFTTSTTDPTSASSYAAKAVISNQPPGVTLGVSSGAGAFEYINGQIVGVVNDVATARAYIIYSTNGTSWTSVLTPATGSFSGCLIEPGKLRFVGYGTQILTVEPVVPNTAPSASDVEFSGTLVAGQVLTGTYTFSDTESDAESGSTFAWYRSDDGAGTGKTAIPGATNNGYELTTDDLGKFISFRVTPSDGTLSGTPVESPVRGPVAAPATTVVSINRASASPTSAATVNYTVTFASAVTGVDAADFNLTAATGTASGIIGTPTGAGTTWTVPVNSLTGTGTVRLDFADAAGITPNASAVFISGEVYTIDRDAPAAPSMPDLVPATDSGLSDSDDLTNDATPTFQGTAEHGSTVTLFDTDGVTVLGTAVAAGDGSWSITSSVLSAGIHTLTAVATDAIGNTSTASQGIAVTIDTSAPTLAISSEEPVLRAGMTAVVTFTFSEDPGNSFAGADITVSGGTLGSLAGTGATRTAVLTPDPNINSGTVSITVSGGAYTDASGNSGATGSMPAIAYDTAVPQLTIASNVPSLKAGEAATITFTFSEDPGLSFTGSDIAVAGGSLSTISGTGTVRTAIFTPVSAVNDGVVSITVGEGLYTDAAGNAGSAGLRPSVTFDTLLPAAPSLPDLAEASDSGTSKSDNITNVVTPVVKGTAEAGSAVTLYDTDGSTVLGTGTATVDGTWSIISSELASGVHAITAKATDSAGNQGPLSGVLELKIDITPPAGPVVVLPAVGSTLTTAIPLITGTAEANSKVAVYIDGVKAAHETADSEGKWKYQVSSPLTNGPHNVSAIATDKAGNTGPASPVTAFGLNIVPSIYVTGTLQTFTSVYKKASAYQKLSISGAGLSSAILVSVPSGFEVSTDNTSFHSSLTLGSGGTTAPVWVYVRLKGTVPAGSYTGSIRLSSAGVSDVLVQTAASNVVTKASLNIKVTVTNREYDGTTVAKVTLTDDRLPGDSLELSYAKAGFDTKKVGEGKKVTVDSIAVSGADAGNYTFNIKAYGTGQITRKKLVITALDKQKLEGTENPALDLTYLGFVKGEDHTVLKALPSLSTTATLRSPAGKYPITVSGALAENYEIAHVDGILKVVTPAPTAVFLSAVPLYENRAAGTLAGEFSAKSDDPEAEFTYALVSGDGDSDNRFFTIAGDKLKTAFSLNFEEKDSYKIRVRVTTKKGYSLDQIFEVVLKDVNEAPTMPVIADVSICYTTESKVIEISDATPGPEAGQTLTYTVSADNASLFEELTINKNGRLSYRVKSGVSGKAMITVTARDNGGTANDGVDTASRNFAIAINPLPEITISSDKGVSISKGMTIRLVAKGGATYSWNNPGGVISGQQSDTLTIRPEKNTIYRVMATTAAGCVSEKEITIEVLDDYQAVNRTNIVTPNGDGVNDNFVIQNLDMYPNNTVKIFDNAGRILYQKTNYTSEWNGTLKGAPLAEGTYYYIVDFGDRKPVLKGYITIVRD